MKIIKHFSVFTVGLLSLLYLLNPGAGFIDFIPDNLPIIGNIDEAAAAFLLLNCLAYFGLDLRHLLSPSKKAKDKDKVVDI